MPTFRNEAQILEAAVDCCASNFSKLARRPGSLIWTMAPPQAYVAAEPAGPVTEAMTRAAKAAKATIRMAIMAVPFRAKTTWLMIGRGGPAGGSIRGMGFT